MSHLKERKDKNCLNCNAHVQGKYCHVCGQENLEPAESAGHLVSHFINDITHFEGKFFSTLKLLIFKPGFLSAEYKRGRRASYLNPVRMYVFTSFFFFVIFFSLFSADNRTFPSTWLKTIPLKQLENLDSTEFADFTKTLTEGRALSREEYPAYVDSLSKVSEFTIVGKYYGSREKYDSLVKAGAVKENWIEKKMTEKNFELMEKYKTQDEALKNLWNKITHYLPQLLFVSLPFFAMFLKLLYVRRKQFYFVSHGIYTVHLYIFYFISLLAIIGLSSLANKLNWAIIDWLKTILIVFMFLYEYKAMRNFYGQGRAKTILKFTIALWGRFFIIVLLAVIFLLLSIINL